MPAVYARIRGENRWFRNQANLQYNFRNE